MFDTFESFIRKEVESFKYYGNFYEEGMKYIPDFFKLLCEILDVKDISFESRIKINCALAYLVVPNDALPEDIYGAVGYMDDIFVIVCVLKELFSKHKDAINKLWVKTHKKSKDKDLELILDKCYSTSKKVLESKKMVDKTLEFAGLKKISIKIKKK